MSGSKKVNTDTAFYCESRAGLESKVDLDRVSQCNSQHEGEESSHRLEKGKKKKKGSDAFQSWLGLVARNPHVVSPNGLQMGPFNKCSSLKKQGSNNDI